MIQQCVKGRHEPIREGRVRVGVMSTDVGRDGSLGVSGGESGLGAAAGAVLVKTVGQLWRCAGGAVGVV